MSQVDDPVAKESVEPSEQTELGNAVTKTAEGAGITAIVVVLILFIRIMAVSGWNWETAAELADAFNFEDAVPILFGTLFELPVLTGFAAALILPLSIYRLYEIRGSHDREATITDWLMILLLAIILFVLVNSYGMWWPILLTVGLTLALVAFAYLVHKGPALQFLDRVSKRTGTLLVIVLLILSVIVTTPWNPRERLILENETLEGHVIDVSPGFLKVLTTDREVKILLTSDVLSRESLSITQ